MGLFSKKSKSPKKETKPKSSRQQSQSNQIITEDSILTPTPKKKTPLKKLKRIFSTKKSKSSPNKKSNANSSGIQLVSPQVTTNQTTKYYSNDTDGFEVILDGSGKQMQYEEKLKNQTTPDNVKSKICGPPDGTCEPLSDWNNFVNLLIAPNINNIFNFVYGEDAADSPSQSPQRTRGKGVNHRYDNGHGHGVVDKTRASVPRRIMSKKSSGSLPFDEDYERSAIETTLENPARGNGDPPVLSQSVNDEGELVEIHPYDRVNDGPIRNRGTSSVQDHSGENNGYAEEPQSSKEAGLFQPFEAKVEGNLPDEEFYDTAFTLKFLREVSNIGVILTYFRVPEDGEEMSSMVVSLTIKPGLSRGSRLLEPKLSWVSMQDSLDEGMSISLLGIDSIDTSVNPNEDDNPFFTITTEEGDVHAFESPTLSERNHIVHGIRNVVAWLSYHLITGQMGSGTELVSDLEEERGESSGELPSLKTPVQAMNELTHSFLD